MEPCNTAIFLVTLLLSATEKGNRIYFYHYQGSEIGYKKIQHKDLMKMNLTVLKVIAHDMYYKIDPLFSQEETEKVLSTNVDELDLSMRAYNAVKCLRIDTVQDIMTVGFDRIGLNRNCGAKTIKEIKDKIKSRLPADQTLIV